MKVTKTFTVLLSLSNVVAFQTAVTNNGVRLATMKLQAEANDRRSFLLSSVAAATASLIAPSAEAAGSVDYKAVANDISAILEKDLDKAPTLIRLAWHSSGTYDKMSKDGGSGPGTIRFKEELAHGGNAGLASTAVEVTLFCVYN